MGRGTRRLPERKLKQLKNVNSPDQRGVSVHTHTHTRPHSRTHPLPLRGEGRLALIGVSNQGHRSDRLRPGATCLSTQGREVPGGWSQTWQGPDSCLGTDRLAAPGFKSQPTGRDDGSSTLTAHPPVSPRPGAVAHGLGTRRNGQSLDQRQGPTFSSPRCVFSEGQDSC